MKQTTTEERFVLLETKLAYLEKHSLDLNDVIISQGRLIDDLRLRIDGLERQLRGFEGGDAVPQERPPHY